MGRSGYFASADGDACCLCCVLTEYKVLERGNEVLIAALASDEDTELEFSDDRRI